ncbi:MAG TPA: FAD-binding oxidoreductase [Candidatus Limnocylindria bacterium]|nr:FAD-binding oxidoreductase [Candidatus Limnocylindria bacterium]
MTTGAAAAADWRALGDVLAGEVIVPASDGYDEARRTANGRYDGVRPAAIVRCATPSDVQEALSLARRRGLGIVARCGGHSMDGRSSTEGVVIDVTPMHDIAISADGVTVGAGTRLGTMYDTLADGGLMVPAGSCPSVGIAGLTLGGGLGFVGRKYGLTCDHLRAASVVLADGRIVDTDQDHDPDLLWALRGGGMLAMGIVTRFVFTPRPATDTTNFRLVWPMDRAVDVIDAWQRWAPASPDELSASLTLTATAALEAPIVEVFGAMLGTEAETVALIDPLVEGVGEPAEAFVRAMLHRDAVAHWAGLGDRFPRKPIAPDSPRPYSLAKSEFFRQPIPSDGIRAVLEHFAAGAALSPERELSFIPWGGAYNRLAPEDTAFPFRHELFTLKHAMTVDPAVPGFAEMQADGWVTRSWELTHPWATGGVFPNFGDPDLADPAAAYYGPNFARLSRVKAQYDPDGALGASIGP